MELVSYQPSYLPLFIEWRNQPLSIRHNPLESRRAEEIAHLLGAEGTNLAALERFANYRWFVVLNGEPVGTVSLKNISHSMGYAEIGYGIAQSHHGKGIATTAVGLLVEKVFRETPLRRLMAFVHVENQASRRVLQNLGFREEGLLREHYVIQNQPVDEVLYGLLRREWKSHPRNARPGR